MFSKCAECMLNENNTLLDIFHMSAFQIDSILWYQPVYFFILYIVLYLYCILINVGFIMVFDQQKSFILQQYNKARLTSINVESPTFPKIWNRECNILPALYVYVCWNVNVETMLKMLHTCTLIIDSFPTLEMTFKSLSFVSTLERFISLW